MENGKFLKERADKFYETAKFNFEKGMFDIAAFNIEQAAQLYIKYAIFNILGDFRKTHNIKQLLEDYYKATKKREVLDFITINLKTLEELEEIYIQSRYIPANFFKEDIEKLFNFLEELKNILNINGLH